MKRLLEQQQMMYEHIMQCKNNAMPQIEITSPLAYQTAKQLAAYKIDTPWLPDVMNMTDNSSLKLMEEVIKSIGFTRNSAFASTVCSPFVEWLNCFDVSSILKIFDKFKIDENLSRYLKKKYLQVMYDCNWFPYAGVLADKSLFFTVNEILSSSRGKSKRRTLRLDKAILDYYSDTEIKKIKQRWNKADLKPYIKKMLIHAIGAHLRGEYVLTISCLATMWEGLLKEKMPQKKRSNSELKEEIKELVDENGYDSILGDFYNNVILQTCYGVENVLDGVPNRHSVAHSWYKKYPNKKASLNAILLTDFIINLTPKLITEEK